MRISRARVLCISLVLVLVPLLPCSTVLSESPRLLLAGKLTPFRFYTWDRQDPKIASWGMMDSEFGLRVWKNLQVRVGADYVSTALRQRTEMLGEHDVTATSIQFFMPHVGVKVSVPARSASTVRTYISAEIFKAYTSVTTEGIQNEYKADLMRPSGLALSMGALSWLRSDVGVGIELGWRRLGARGSASSSGLTKTTTFRYSSWYTALVVELGLF